VVSVATSPAGDDHRMGVVRLDRQVRLAGGGVVDERGGLLGVVVDVGVADEIRAHLLIRARGRQPLQRGAVIRGVRVAAMPVERDGDPRGSGPARAFQAEDRAQFATIDAVSHYHALQVQDFLRAIVEDRPPLVTGDDGRTVVALFQAIYRSNREGRSIRLPG
jgi:hypothetical protein